MMVSLTRFIGIFCLIITLSGCIGAIVDTAVDTTVAVAKVPIKVAGSVIDAASKDKEKKSDSSEQQEPESKPE